MNANLHTEWQDEICIPAAAAADLLPGLTIHLKRQMKIEDGLRVVTMNVNSF